MKDNVEVAVQFKSVELPDKRLVYHVWLQRTHGFYPIGIVTKSVDGKKYEEGIIVMERYTISYYRMSSPPPVWCISVVLQARQNQTLLPKGMLFLKLLEKN